MLLQNIKSLYGKLYTGLSALLEEEKKFEENVSHKVNRTFSRPETEVLIKDMEKRKYCFVTFII